jgi:predicted secreted protein
MLSPAPCSRTLTVPLMAENKLHTRTKLMSRSTLNGASVAPTSYVLTVTMQIF